MSRFRVLAAGMAAAVVAVLAVASPASAHDELLSSTPTEGEVFASAPDTVSLDFSADILTMGAIIVIADADEVDWADGDAVYDGTRVTSAVKPGMPAAGYELRWRVVSSDGHPIAGVIPFTIGDGEPLVRAADAGSTPTPAAVAALPDQTTQGGGVLRVVLLGAGGAIVAVAVLVLIRFLRRRDAPVGPGSADVPSDPENS